MLRLFGISHFVEPVLCAGLFIYTNNNIKLYTNYRHNVASLSTLYVNKLYTDHDLINTHKDIYSIIERDIMYLRMYGMRPDTVYKTFNNDQYYTSIEKPTLLGMSIIGTGTMILFCNPANIIVCMLISMYAGI